MAEPEWQSSNRDLVGHTVLVTGAAGPGVGSGVCDAVYAAGARLVVNGLTDEDVGRTVERYPGSVGVVGDVSRPGDVDRMIDEATRTAGALTGLVNNAGVGLNESMLDTTEEQFDRVVGVDFRGVWLMSRAFARTVVARGRESIGAVRGRESTGAIVNVSSVHAAKTMGRYGIYASAKAAVEGLTRGFAVDLGPSGVRCNAVAPGYVPINRELAAADHPRHDPAWIAAHTDGEQVLRRVIEPIDCGWAVTFLLSERSRCITGQVLTVDAGLTARLYNEDMTTRIYADRRSQMSEDEAGGAS